MPLTPVTRTEIYLAKASGEYSGKIPEPITREEQYLYEIAMSGGDAYTKSETDTLLASKADLVNGTVPLSQIPPAAIEKIVTVANDTARFALTTTEVQLGDTVKVTSTNKMYFVIDTDHLDGELGYQVYVAGKAAEAVSDQNGDTIDTTYVKIVSGKQLSTEDYTTAEKTKLSDCQTGWIGTESEYSALTQKDFDLYFIYEEESTASNSAGTNSMNTLETSSISPISGNLMSDTLDISESETEISIDKINSVSDLTVQGDETE